MSEQVITQNAEVVDAAELSRRKTFTKNKWFFSAGGIGRDMSYQLIATFLLTYVQFGVSLTLAQFTTLSLIIGVGGRIWDAINDPLMGAIIEGTHMKWGKFKPWIFIGAISCSAVILAMFNVQSLTGWSFVVFMCVMYLLWESTFTMNDIGYWAMLPSLSSVKKERNSITMLTVLFAGVGAIIAQGVIPMLTVGDMRSGYRMVSLIVVAAFIICQTVTAFCVKEQPHLEDKKGEKVSLKKMFNTIKKNDQVLWMTLSMLFYNIGSALLVAFAANILYMEIAYDGDLYFYIVVAYGVTSVFVNVIYPWLVGKLGRKKLQLWSIIAACAGYVLIGLMGWTEVFPVNIALFAVFVVFVSAGQSLFYMASIVNMTNCVEYNEYKQGERNEAVVSTLRPFMAKFAAALQTLIVTIVLTVSGVFILSQSISTLETQKDFFALIKDQAGQITYMQNVQEYLTYFDGVDRDSEQFAQAVKEVEKLIADDKVMSSYQLDANYVPSLSEAMIMKYSLDDKNAIIEGSGVEVGRLGKINLTELASQTGVKYTLEVGKLTSGNTSGADLVFKLKSTTAMRIWIRIAATVVPIIFLLLALYIQRKKFVIDENYYDMMMKEIDNREKAEIEAENK